MTVPGVPLEFLIFGVTLLAIALFHGWVLPAALTGLALTTLYKFATLGLAGGGAWFIAYLGHEWAILANLLLLLVGFAILANQFERSALPDAMPRFLPDDWTGGLALLAMVFVLSIFLDNIAAAIIGGVIARHVYQGRVTVAFLAGIVAAANAGGAGSVIGDTTTTMMWIQGISPVVVLDAFIASFAAFAVFAPVVAIHQQRSNPIAKDNLAAAPSIDWPRAIIVLILLAAIFSVNVAGHAFFPGAVGSVPLLGIGLWVAIVLTAPWRSPDWRVMRSSIKGAAFLVALVATAAMMPVERLPVASWQTAFGLGIVSAVFDNIPLTALALKQGGYDWGLLAFSVGYGGSMLWFGSSAGVALSALYPEVKSVVRWLRFGWIVAVANVVGFMVRLWVLGWQPP